MKNDFANKEDIRYAESLLLPKNNRFEDDKIKIIRCNETRHIKACPGSGKTTALLAKVAIIANRMPFENNQGICVLTHTNVAINEIKNKLGHKSDILFSYPNHFGTIQSFVDKFLAIPNFNEMFGYKLKYIDDDFSKHKIREKYFNIQSFDNTKWIYPQIKDRIPNLKSGPSKTKIINDLKKEFIEDVITCFDNDIFYFKSSYSSKRALAKDESSDTYKFLKNIIYSTIQEGFLKYMDAYSLGINYVENHSQLKNAFTSRFKYVFIDEMQDTDIHQLEIIEKIFDNSNTIIQYFGDPNQSIFNKTKADNVWEPENSLQIDSSKRFGENIAEVLRYVCMESNLSLQANKDINSLKPHLILFQNPLDVLPKYCELVATLKIELPDGSEKTIDEIAKHENKAIKAVGWVGEPNSEYKSEDQLTIQSYFSPFRKNIKKKEKVDFDSLKSFVRPQDNATVRDYSNRILMALIHILSSEKKKPVNGRGNRNYTKTTLLSELRELNPELYTQLNEKMASWSFRIHSSNGLDGTVLVEVKKFVTNDFLNIYGVATPNSFTRSFLDSEPNDNISVEEIKSNNIFTSDEFETTQIELGTIHSVKGETHAATLLLETSYYGKHESERILKQLEGKTIVRRNGDSRIIETLKMAYVAMSRPKYLLSMAVSSERISEDYARENLEPLGWEVITTS